MTPQSSFAAVPSAEDRLSPSRVGWTAVLEQCRHAPRGAFDLRRYWRSTGYAEAQGDPEPVRRARAFAAILEHIPLHRYAGEAVAGSRRGFCVDVLPPGISETAYSAAIEADTRHGERNFQVGFDHACPDYVTLLRDGIGGVRQRVEQRLLDAPDPSQRDTLAAFLICLDALGAFVRRHRDLHAAAGNAELAAVLDSIIEAPPSSFREALQLIWMVHLAFVAQGRYAMALGRLDQTLQPFYRADVEAGRLDRSQALSLLCHLWTKIEELGEVTNITVGGLTPEGEDALNDVSYLCIDATRLVQSPHTNLSARLCPATPAPFLRRCFECIRTGVGFPALFNDEILISGLTRIGIPPETARDYCLVGCIETHFPGRQQAWGDGVPGFKGESNIQCFDRALHRLAAEDAPSYERLAELFRVELRTFFKECARRVNEHIRRYPPDRFPDPFLSVLTRDCIARAQDINAGGAQIPRFYKCAGGENLATLADSMAALKTLVFDEPAVDLHDLIAALDDNFADREPLRQQLLHRAPKYGNDEPLVDRIAADMLDLVAAEVERLPPVAGGGRFVPCAAGNIHNIVRGKHMGATPDGRRAGEPLSDATSPHFGHDRNGPTAVLSSMARTPCGRILGGRVANMKFDPVHFEGEDGTRRFVALIRHLIDARIQELQVNFTDNRTLQDAMDNPDAYRDLVVRVSGFSAYFTSLRPEVQNDVIRRRAHG